MIYEQKSNCYGCTACLSACPVKAIKMIEDEKGFLYPKIDEEKCIKCGLCKKICGLFHYRKIIGNEKICFCTAAYIFNCISGCYFF